MGAGIKTENFTDADRDRFARRLDDQLRALDVVLQRPDFGKGRRTLGVELELSVVDSDGYAYAIAERIVRDADCPSITPEMGAFDIELSTQPEMLEGKPFSALRGKMAETVARIRDIAARYDARVVPIGILPTLRVDDFNSDAITAEPRYQALARGMLESRGGAFTIAIEGEDRLHFASRDAVAMEGANTAFQVHLSTSPDEFATLFNAAMILAGPVLAAAANSPTFLGKKLWHETRVALFKQAGDDRPWQPDADFMRPPRIDFGSGWVREGAHELFLESVAIHPTLLPDCSEPEDSLAKARSGGIPNLWELRLHHGTVWNWNRPVYDPDHGGGLRIELRALPAGPTYDDMLANAAFQVGAMLGIAERIPDMVASLPFALARQNFFAAAELGLDAELAWPSVDGSSPLRTSARDLLLELLPAARAGLASAGVAQEEIDYFLGVFEQRVRSGRTPAVWQRQTLTELHDEGQRGYEALTGLLDRYIAGFESERPVHAWSADPREAEVIRMPTEETNHV